MSAGPSPNDFRLRPSGGGRLLIAKARDARGADAVKTDIVETPKKIGAVWVQAADGVAVLATMQI